LHTNFSAHSAVALVGLGLVTALPHNQAVALDDPYFESGPDLGVGVTAGTLGLGIEASTKLTDMLVVRLIGTGLDWNHAYIGDDYNYDWDAQIRSLGLVADLHPFGGGLRLSAGLRYIDLNFEGSANYTARYSIGNGTYLSSEIGDVTITNRIDTVAPYLGVGYDSTHFDSALSFGIDIGALYVGDSDVDLTTTRSIAGLAADIQREEDKLKGAKWFRDFYPVVMMSLKYRF